MFRRVRDVTRLLRLRDTAVVRVGPHLVHIDLLDQRALKVLTELGETSIEFSVLGNVLPPGGTFVDLGMNHGRFSIRAAALVGPHRGEYDRFAELGEWPEMLAAAELPLSPERNLLATPS